MKELDRSTPGERVVFRRPGRTERSIRRLFARPNSRAVMILGNQKSGTTAIAALLAHHVARRATIDFYPHLTSDDLLEARRGREGFDRFVRRFRWEFSRALVKEPSLGVFHRELRRRFPDAPFLWVVRDPRDNLRSILNRLDLPGDAAELPGLEERLPAAWRLVFDTEWLGLPGGSYIERLARRWRAIAEDALERHAASHLVRYEDFVADREGVIAATARQLGLPAARPIGHLVDRQFQSRGHRDVTWDEFFGADNLRRIERICGPTMALLGYETSTEQHVV